MKSAGVIALLVLAAFAAPAYSARGPGRSLIVSGECPDGNIKNVTCDSGYFKCTVDAIEPGGTVTASCPGGGGVVVKVTFASDKESVTFTVDGQSANNIKAYIKGGNAYCYYESGPYDTPLKCGTAGNLQRCGFSHAEFCVLECDCEAKIQAALDAANPPFNPAGYCPGSTLPPVDITACSKITATPTGLSSCSNNVVYSARCPGGTAHTSVKTYVSTDSNFTLVPNPGGCPSATSKCLPTTGAIADDPKCTVGATDCKVTVTYTITGACGQKGTGSLTYNT
jgi:hypothetical protein